MQKQQEEMLLAAFRAMHPEDRLILISFAHTRAERYAKSRRDLRLVVTGAHPPKRIALGNASG